MQPVTLRLYKRPPNSTFHNICDELNQSSTAFKVTEAFSSTPKEVRSFHGC